MAMALLLERSWMIAKDFLQFIMNLDQTPVQGNPAQTGGKRSTLKTVYPIHETTTHVKSRRLKAESTSYSF